MEKVKVKQKNYLYSGGPKMILPLKFRKMKFYKYYHEYNCLKNKDYSTLSEFYLFRFLESFNKSLKDWISVGFRSEMFAGHVLDSTWCIQ